MAGYIVAGRYGAEKGRLHSHPSFSLADVLVPARGLGRVHGMALRRAIEIPTFVFGSCCRFCAWSRYV